MTHVTSSRFKKSSVAALAMAATLAATPIFGQAPPPYAPPPGAYPPQQGSYPPPPSYPPQELDRVVQRIALYPDSLLAQVLAAATFPDQIPDAARYADQHHYLTGDQLAAAISGDQVPWDPSVQALIPFPSVLDMMASDMAWTQELGNAFLSQQQMVMDAVQRERKLASSYGYLRTNQQVVVSGGPYIEIAPVNPAFVCVPVYDPLIVYARPRPGFFIGGAINFGFGVSIGAAFRPWGWGYNRFAWNTHTVVINNAPWRRTWVNRTTYVHPYVATVHRAPVVVARPGYAPPRVVEHHEVHERSVQERDNARYGRAPHAEEHRGGGEHGDTANIAASGGV